MNDNIKTLDFLDNFLILNEKSTVLDIGANIGDITNRIFEKYKCNIHAYEPNIACYNYMKKRFMICPAADENTPYNNNRISTTKEY